MMDITSARLVKIKDLMGALMCDIDEILKNSDAICNDCKQEINDLMWDIMCTAEDALSDRAVEALEDADCSSIDLDEDEDEDDDDKEEDA